MWSFEEKHSVALVALDLSAAFDTVDHVVLLSILEKEFGISGTALTWFTSYLSARSYVVKINDSCSHSQGLCFRVPQISVAGPSLYGAYASPIKEVVINHDVTINGFADDHALLKPWTSGLIAKEKDALSTLELCLGDIKQ